MSQLVRQTYIPPIVRTSQPQQPVDLDIPSGVPRFVMLGSVGAIDCTRKNALTITGTPFVGAPYGGNKTVRFNTSNYFTSSAKIVDRSRFTVIFVGSLDAPLTTNSCHLFGQFQANGTLSDASVFDWSIYEGTATDGIYLQVSNGTTNVATQPANAPAWITNKQRRVAASFDNGVPRISVDGGAAATGSTLSGGQISNNWGVGSGGYWSGSSGYNPFVRIALAVVIDGWAASAAELKELSDNPWQIFKPIARYYPIDLVRGPLQIRQSRMLGTSDGAASSVAPAVLGLRSVWTQQPQGPAEIDAGNSLAVRSAWVGSSPLVVQGIGSVSAFSAANIAFGVPSAIGRTTSFTNNTGTNLVYAADADLALPSNNCTIAILRRCRDTTNRDSTVFGYSVSATDTAQIVAPYTDGNFYFDFGTSGTTGRLSVAYTKDTEWETIVCVAGSSKGREIWRRGVKLAGNNTKTATRPATASALRVGSKTTGDSCDNQDIALICVAHKEWSDAEIRWWCQNPWQIFKPLNRQVWVAA